MPGLTYKSVIRPTMTRNPSGPQNEKSWQSKKTSNRSGYSAQVE